MTISLFQLSATAWLNPRMVGQAIQGTKPRQLLRWAPQARDAMRAAGVDPNRVSRFEAATKNLEIVAGGRDSIKALRVTEKLARLIAGVRDEAQWGEVVQRAQWPQNIPTIFAATTSRSSRHEIAESKRQEWMRIAEWFGDSESVFDQRVTKFWEDDEGTCYYFYDVAGLVMLGQHYIRHSETVNRRIYRAILNANLGAIKAFQRFWNEEIFVRDTVQWKEKELEMLAYLLKEGEEDYDALWWLSMVTGNSVWQARRYRKYFKHYSETPVLRLTPYSSLSKGEKIAIYIVTKRINENVVLHEKELAFPDDWFPRFDDFFEDCLRVECALARFSKAPVALEDFARRFSRMFFDDPDSIPFSSSYFILLALLERRHFAVNAKILKVAEAIFQKERSVREAFRNNVGAWPLSVSLDPAMEFLEGDLPFDGALFREYASRPKEQRLAEKEQVDGRAKELVRNPQTVLKSLEDPFEVMAILRLLGKQAPEPGVVLDILREAKVPPRSADTYYAPFSFEVRELPLPPHSAFSKLSLYAEKLLNLQQSDILVDEIEDVLADFVQWGPEKIRNAPEIREASRRIERLPLGLDDEDAPEFNEYYKKVGEALKVLEDVLQFFSRMIRQRTSALMAHREPEQRAQIKQRVINEYADYFGRLLVAWSVHKYFWEEIQYASLRSYKHGFATQKEDFRALNGLAHFFDSQLQTAMSHFFQDEKFPLPSQIKLRFRSKKGEYYDEDVLKGINGMVQNRREISPGKIGSEKKVEVRLIPDVGELACFYGYMSENCLAKADWAIHAMSDTGFVPYRIVVGDEWRGVVQTFTRFVTVDGQRRKFLIVSGIDPQPDLLIDPEEFLTGLEKGFGRIALGKYHSVVVPAKDFAQSSRRDFLRREFNRYTVIEDIDRPVGFPQIGVKPDGSPLYYSNEEHGEAWHDEFLWFRTGPL